MQNTYGHRFSGSLQIPALQEQSAYFTIKYRTHSSGLSPSWQWVNQNFGLQDGELLIQGPPNEISSTSKTIAKTLELEKDFVATQLSSEAPDAELWDIQSLASLPPSGNVDARTQSKRLAMPLNLRKWFALVRIWSPWLAPRHGSEKLHLSEDALLCSFLHQSGLHTVIVALNGVGDILTLLRSDEEGNIVVTARNDGQEDGRFRLLVGVAHDFGVALCAVIYEARKIVGTLQIFREPEKASTHAKTESVDADTVLVTKEDLLEPQWLENWYDGLAYCTWNGLGQDLSESKILTALESLEKEGIRISNLIIDDNWQSLDGTMATSQFVRGWREFEANPEGFPKGLKHTTSTIRAKYPRIKHIAVWHALLGYWGGISSEGKLASTYKTKEVKKQDGIAGGTMLTIDPDDAHRMYDDFYSFLSSAGIDSVKTDAQFFLDLLASTPDRRRFTTTYQDAWTIAHLRHFSAKAISCMSQIPQIMFHSMLPRNQPTILIRNSDDFFPDVPSSHPWHVFCNAHNALFIQHLNVLPDWDMFQTAHPWGRFHGAARCLSGGPIYITDTPGSHDVELINEMTARNPRGQTVILRPSCIGKTTDIYNNYNDGCLLKIGAYNGGAAKTGTSILGCFNIAEREVSALVPMADFRGIAPETVYIIRSHLTGRVSRPMPVPSVRTHAVDSVHLTSVTLPARGYEVLTAYPLQTFTYPPPSSSSSDPTTSTISLAPLGLLSKLTASCALMSCDIFIIDPSSSTSSTPSASATPLPSSLSSHRRLSLSISLKALGVLGIYISDLADRDIQRDFFAVMKGQGVSGEFVRRGVGDAGSGKGGVLELDVEGAWDSMGLDAGWGNEVQVEVFVRLG
ncbi:MAG: hypothetical protein Q9160_004410 [Pyrenula sp. 1 TL-2023]